MKLTVTIECHREGEHLHEVTVEADVSAGEEYRFDNLTTYCATCEDADRSFTPWDLTSWERQTAEDMLSEAYERAEAERAAADGCDYCGGAFAGPGSHARCAQAQVDREEA